MSKGTFYYVPVGQSDEELEIMKAIDLEHLEHPTKGVIQMREHLRSLGYTIGNSKTRRLMRLMDIHAVYPKPSLSKLGRPVYKREYLLRNLDINHPNHVWSTDITYVPMAKGFMYLYAIIDVYSRLVVAWGLFNTLEAANAIEVLERAITDYGPPEIINSDQGSQYTCEDWIETCKAHDIKVSMDGRARCLDNIWIERFWRTVKYDYIYLNPCDNGIELREGIRSYIDYYNTRRPHQGLGNQIPEVVFRAQTRCVA